MNTGDMRFGSWKHSGNRIGNPVFSGFRGLDGPLLQQLVSLVLRPYRGGASTSRWGRRLGARRVQLGVGYKEQRSGLPDGGLFTAAQFDKKSGPGSRDLIA